MGCALFEEGTEFLCAGIVKMNCRISDIDSYSCISYVISKYIGYGRGAY
jgi:hypothetical protein